MPGYGGLQSGCQEVGQQSRAGHQVVQPGDGAGLSSHFLTCHFQMTENVKQWQASGSTEISPDTENRPMHLEHENWKTVNDYWNKCNEQNI